jgi:hypothetical protein
MPQTPTQVGGPNSEATKVDTQLTSSQKKKKKRKTQLTWQLALYHTCVRVQVAG